MSRLLQISEIFGPTIQGEGAQIGRPTLFVRSGGCDYRCSWCDTMFAVDPAYNKDWRKMTTEDVFAELKRLSFGKPMSVTLSGGNPALQPFGELIDMGQAKGYDFSMETQGSITRDWFAKLDAITFSPKPPSSGMQTDWDQLEQSIQAAGNRPQKSLKVVVFDEGDYAYAQEVSDRFPTLSLFLQAGNPRAHSDLAVDIPDLLDRLRWLAEKVATDCWTQAAVLPQLHVLAWGNKRGV